MRVVLDTDVVVAGLRSDRGASRKLLAAALDGRIVVLASVPLFLEYEAVLTRPEQRAEIGLSVREINVFLDTLAAAIEQVVFRFLWKPQLRDPADEMVLETAVNGQADRIATFNVRHLREAAAFFGISAARPGEIWEEFRRREHEKK
jgi:putative PIN family toxin of toxin-antitoxin system